MKKMIFVLSLALCAGFVFTGAASAQTACFDWACGYAGGDFGCDFDATCSTASPYVWKYEFDYGDGTGSGLSGSPTHSHEYADATYESTVSLTIYYFSGSGSTTATCTINIHVPPVGPVPPASAYSGRCTN